MCLQAATGNINSCFLCIDDTDRSFVISCGITIVAADGHPDLEKNEVLTEDGDKVD